MKSKLIAVFASILLSACGGGGAGGEREIIIHEETPISDIHQMSGSKRNGAYTTWNNTSCHIYMPPHAWLEQHYAPTCYTALFQHELRHCDEGNYHNDDIPDIVGCELKVN